MQRHLHQQQQQQQQRPQQQLLRSREGARLPVVTALLVLWPPLKLPKQERHRATEPPGWPLHWPVDMCQSVTTPGMLHC
jgi:hypothetical protein